MGKGQNVSQKVDHWAAWMFERRHGGDASQLQQFTSALAQVRDRILYHAQLSEGETLLDVGTGDGLIALGALEIVSERGSVIFSDVSQNLLDACQHKVDALGSCHQSRFLLASADDLGALNDASVDVVTTRSVLIFVKDKKKALQEFYRVLRPGGRMSIFEPINRLSHPGHPHLFWGYDVTPLGDMGRKLYDLYERLQPTATDPMYDFDERDLLDLAEHAGFTEIAFDLQVSKKPAAPMRWETFLKMAGNPLIPTIEEAINQALTSAEAAQFFDYLQLLVEQGHGISRQAVVYLWATK